MITCHKLIEFLDDYVDDRLPPVQRARFGLHLKMCKACRQYLDSYQQVIQLQRDATDVDDDQLEPMPEPLVSAILTVMKTSDCDIKPKDQPHD